MACSFAEQSLDGEVNYISGIEPSGIKRERPFQTQLRSTRLSLSAGSLVDPSRKPAPDTSQETQAEPASRSHERGSAVRRCKKQSWLRDRIVGETGEVGRPGPDGPLLVHHRSREGVDPKASASAGESC